MFEFEINFEPLNPPNIFLKFLFGNVHNFLKIWCKNFENQVKTQLTVFFTKLYSYAQFSFFH